MDAQPVQFAQAMHEDVRRASTARATLVQLHFAFGECDAWTGACQDDSSRGNSGPATRSEYRQLRTMGSSPTCGDVGPMAMAVMWRQGVFDRLRDRTSDFLPPPAGATPPGTAGLALAGHRTRRAAQGWGRCAQRTSLSDSAPLSERSAAQ